MSATERAKGSRWEQTITRYFNERGYTAERRAPGQHIDRGDVIVYGIPITVECKNHTRFNLAGWVDQAREAADKVGNPIAVVVAKRRGTTNSGDAYAILRLNDFMKLLPPAETMGETR